MPRTLSCPRRRRKVALFRPEIQILEQRQLLSGTAQPDPNADLAAIAASISAPWDQAPDRRSPAGGNGYISDFDFGTSGPAGSAAEIPIVEARDTAIATAGVDYNAVVGPANNQWTNSEQAAWNAYEGVLNGTPAQPGSSTPAQPGANQILEDVRKATNQAAFDAAVTLRTTIKAAEQTRNSAAKQADDDLQAATQQAREEYDDAVAVAQKTRGDAIAAASLTLIADTAIAAAVLVLGENAYWTTMGALMLLPGDHTSEFQAAEDALNAAKKAYLLDVAAAELDFVTEASVVTKQYTRDEQGAWVAQQEAVAQAQRACSEAQAQADRDYVASVAPGIAAYQTAAAAAELAFDNDKATETSQLQIEIARLERGADDDLAAAAEQKARAIAAAVSAWARAEAAAEETFKNAVAVAAQGAAGDIAAAEETFKNAAAAATTTWVATAAAAGTTLANAQATAAAAWVTAESSAQTTLVGAEAAAGVSWTTTAGLAGEGAAAALGAAGVVYAGAIAAADTAATGSFTAVGVAWVVAIGSAWATANASVASEATTATRAWAVQQGTAYATLVADVIDAYAAQVSADAAAEAAYSSAEANAAAAQANSDAQADAAFVVAQAAAGAAWATGAAAAWALFDSVAASAAASQATLGAAAWALLVTGDAQSGVTWAGRAAQADEALANAGAAAAAQWVAAEATAATSYATTVAAADTSWVAAEATAATARAGATADADQSRAGAIAAAGKDKALAFNGARYDFLAGSWPSWVTKVQAINAARAAWADTVWHAYATQYQVPVADATLTWVQTVAPAQQDQASAVAQAWKGFNIAMEDLRQDAAVAAATQQEQHLQGLDPVFFSWVTPGASAGISDAAMSFISDTATATWNWISAHAGQILDAVGYGGQIFAGVVTILGSAATGCVPAGLVGLYLVGRGADGLYHTIYGGEKFSAQAVGYLCDQSGCTPETTALIKTVTEFGLTVLDMFAEAGLASGRLGCFVAGTWVVPQEASEITTVLAGAAVVGGVAGWDELLAWVEGHRGLVAVGCLVIGVGLGSLAAAGRRRGRDRREDRVDAALASDEGWGRRPDPQEPDEDEEWDWARELPARFGRRALVAV